MDIEPITGCASVGRAQALWMEYAAALGMPMEVVLAGAAGMPPDGTLPVVHDLVAAAPDGLLHRHDGGLPLTGYLPDADPVGGPAAQGPKSALLQASGLPQAHLQPGAAPVRSGAASTDVQTALQEPPRGDRHAVPALDLLPGVAIGLHIDPAQTWALPYATPQPLPLQPRPSQPEEQAPPRAARPPRCDEPEPPPQDEGSPRHEELPESVVVQDADAAWCDTLNLALRGALDAGVAPPALRTLADQWQRGRCVVLACPQAAPQDERGWLFVLWPQTPAGPASATAVPPFFGLRVPVRLQWNTPPRGDLWRLTRLMRQHHPRFGRQLVAAEAGMPGARQAFEVQLGPPLGRTLRPCDAVLHVRDAQRTWAALGRQWSVHAAVCAFPLLPPEAAA